MTARQIRQLQGVEDMVSAMVAELNPRIIRPSAQQQTELGIAEETMFIPVGPQRAISLSAGEDGGWVIKEFDLSSGGLLPVWSDTSTIANGGMISAVIGAAIGSLREQLGLKGARSVPSDLRPIMQAQIVLFEERNAQLVEKGLGSFEFIADDPA